MNTYTDKTAKNSGRAVANSLAGAEPQFSRAVANRASVAQRKPAAGPGNVIQLFKINAGPYDSVMNELLKMPQVRKIVEERLKTGDINIKQAKDDDTYWDRKTSTIFVSNKKKGAEIKAAILFELNNAVNPHTNTDNIEKRMMTLSEKGVDLTGPDFFGVGQEMEKDEFLSLKNYKEQVEASGASGKELATLKEKYASILGGKGELDYDLFVKQNISSGHTMDLARLQYANYTGKDMSLLDTIMPLRLRDPMAYEQYRKGAMRPRQKGKIEETLKEEEKAKLDNTTPELFNEKQEKSESKAEKKQEKKPDIKPAKESAKESPEGSKSNLRELDSGDLDFEQWAPIATEAMKERKVTRQLDRPLSTLLKMAYDAGYTANMFADMMENGTW